MINIAESRIGNIFLFDVEDKVNLKHIQEIRGNIEVYSKKLGRYLEFTGSASNNTRNKRKNCSTPRKMTISLQLRDNILL